MLAEHMTNAIRILGLDPGLRRTGWGVIVIEGARLGHVAHGVIAPKETLALAERLLVLFEGVAEVVARYAPMKRRSRRPSSPPTAPPRSSSATRGRRR